MTSERKCFNRFFKLYPSNNGTITSETFKSTAAVLVGKGKIMEKTPSGIVYECVRCGSTVPSEELELRGGEIKCIVCGYRILKKIKPPVVKRVQAK
jgi:DNA-directed RNA polymerase subunit RPC12/RpoP